MTKLTDTQSGPCPKCGSNWDGGSVLETFKKQRDGGNPYWQMSDKEMEDRVKESYGAVDKRWTRIIGVELPYDHPEHYDGISYWQCPDCKTTWNRFTRKEEAIP